MGRLVRVLHRNNMAPVTNTRRKSSIPAHEIAKLNEIFSTKKQKMEDYPAFKVNDGETFNMEMLPDPPGTVPFPEHVAYDATHEPKFDAAKHLNLETPANVSVFDDEEGFKTLDGAKYRTKSNHKGSEFAYSASFQVFSEEGARAGRSILTELKKSASDNGRSKCFRGIWHLSPFFKDMMLSKEFLGHLETICGEAVLPHFYLHNTQINIGKVGAKGPVDQWHFDSVNYVAVALLSDISNMKGGQLELVKHPKQEAINMICNETYTKDDLLSVSYDAMGKCILVQGCKLIHHVTRVEEAKEDRISLIISLSPANAYHPDHTIYHSMQNLDCNAVDGIPQYEFFRQKAWHCKSMLEGYCRNQTFTGDKKLLSDKLRAVAEEITRTADLLEEKQCDKIGFFAEKGTTGSKWLK